MSALAKQAGKLIDIIEDECLIQPNKPVGIQEKVIGEVNEKARRAYLDAVKIQSGIQDLKQRLKSTKKKELEAIENELYQARLRLNQKISDVLLEVSDRHPSVRQTRVFALRKGWLLVSLPSDGSDGSSPAIEIPPIETMFIQA